MQNLEKLYDVKRPHELLLEFYAGSHYMRARHKRKWPIRWNKHRKKKPTEYTEVGKKKGQNLDENQNRSKLSTEIPAKKSTKRVD